MATLNGYLDGLKHKNMNYVLISAKCLKIICELEFCFFLRALSFPDVYARQYRKFNNLGIRDDYSVLFLLHT